MNKLIWISGISGTGKTTLANFFLKKNKNFIHLDGDIFRQMFNNDIGYTLKDRNINAERLINFVSFLNQYKLNIIVSANLTSNKYKELIMKKFRNLTLIHLETELNILKNRDNKNIYKKNKNVVGKDIKVLTNSKLYHYLIVNNYSKDDFLINFKKILKRINL